MKNNSFIKSHGLGNEYIILDSENITFALGTNAIKRICNIHFGLGSDGILLKVPSNKADFGLRIFNPDGSEAEKSGNGLRIFCKFLFDYHFASSKEFTVETKGGIVRAKVIETENDKASLISVDMGKAIFSSRDIPVNSDKPEFIAEKITAGDREFEVNCVSVGNPHCVVIKEQLDVAEIKKYGPLLENHPMFPNRINVQFAKPVNRNTVKVIIWERGAGYTLASGSSSCAVACALYKRGFIDANPSIVMKGGTLKIEIDDEWQIRMTGEIKETASGVLSDELLKVLDIPMIEE
ncbi:MAG: diaminopimelate epimerase [Bacteroidales bacterium]|nr:diaminopimelate epimerase [Bacteroidales bacterium]